MAYPDDEECDCNDASHAEEDEEDPLAWLEDAMCNGHGFIAEHHAYDEEAETEEDEDASCDDEPWLHARLTSSVWSLRSISSVSSS